MNSNRLRDTEFVLREQLKIEDLASHPKCSDFGWDSCRMILEGAVEMATRVLAPISSLGDHVGARFEGGRVILPPEYQAAWKTYRTQGWNGFGMSEEWGGCWVPRILFEACLEYLVGANLAFMSFSSLTTGAGRLIENFGDADLRTRFVSKMYSGQWTGTMCLTEPEAGSDLGRVMTRAEPWGDHYRITGNKIFITCGDHDLSENIIHLVLARLPDAPQGTAGISLFVVPKAWVAADGTLEGSNDVEATSLEHKMGIKVSPTATLHFGSQGRCRGLLLGTPHRGLAHMFQMMNEARIGTGIKALGVASEAYSAALSYAKERIQGRPFTDRRSDAVRIIEHEDVRRMLIQMKSLVEGMRALIYTSAYLSTVEELDWEGQGRRAGERLALLTPLVKAYCSDRCFEICRDAIQTMGGAGYLSDYPVEQLTRDSKILSIWEGTNYIQSLDLVGRKLQAAEGRVFANLIEETRSFCRQQKDRPALRSSAAVLLKAVDKIESVVHQYSVWMGSPEMARIPWSSTRFLDSMAEVVIAKLLLEQGVIALERLEDKTLASPQQSFYQGKITVVRHYCTNILPQACARTFSILEGDDSALRLEEEAF